jgi:TolB-like protein
MNTRERLFKFPVGRPDSESGAAQESGSHFNQGCAAAQPYRQFEAMNTRKYLPFLLLAALAMFANAADAPKPAPTVAVYDFTGEAEAASYGRKATSLVTADLAGNTNFSLVERAQLTEALSEQAFGISGMVSSDAAAKIGQMTGANVLVCGQVVKIGDNHLVVVADIVGTETGRLFADKVEGAADHLLDLTTELSRKIAQSISDQETNLLAAAQEPREARLARIIKSATGTNRPSVSVDIREPRAGIHPRYIINAELASILMKAGFTIADDNSERKPDVQITGVSATSEAPQQITQPSFTFRVTGPGGPADEPMSALRPPYTVQVFSVDESAQESQQGVLFSISDSLDFKVQERRTGDILLIDHLTASASSGAHTGATLAADVAVADAMAEKVLPLLAK